MHLSGIDLNLLPVLHAILETSSVQAAAKRVSLSPSAVSHALSRGRDVFDDPLVVRAGRKLTPTPRGKRLARELAPLLAGLDSAMTASAERAPEEQTRRFTIGCNDHAEFTLIQPLGLELAERAPGIDIYCTNPKAPFDALRDGDIDLGISVFRSSPPDVNLIPLVQDEFVSIVRSDHPVLDRRWTLSRYLELEHVLVSPRGTPGGVVDSVLESLGKSRRVARTVSNFLAAPLLIADSDYVATMSRRVVEKLPLGDRLRILRPPLKLPPYTVSLAWHRRSKLDAGVQWLIEEFRRVA